MSNEPQWVPRIHQSQAVVKTNERVRDIVAVVIPQYQLLHETAYKADELAQKLWPSPSQNVQWPTTPEAFTADWLDDVVDQRLGARDIEARLQVLRELAFYARTDANDLFDEKSDEIFAALAEQLAELVAAASVTVDALGPVNTAADAIEGGMTDAWKVIQNQLKVYREIRRAQSALYACLKWPFDRRAFGDSGSPNTQADSDARIYYHRRLPEVAPGWDDQRTTDAFGRDTPPRSIPWPDDAAERFIWCIRNDSGIWCPSPSELNALTNAIPERRTNGVERVNRVKRQYSEKTLAHRGAVDDSAHGFTSPGPAELISTPAIWVPPETET